MEVEGCIESAINKVSTLKDLRNSDRLIFEARIRRISESLIFLRENAIRDFDSLSVEVKEIPGHFKIKRDLRSRTLDLFEEY